MDGLTQKRMPFAMFRLTDLNIKIRARLITSWIYIFTYAGRHIQTYIELFVFRVLAISNEWSPASNAERDKKERKREGGIDGGKKSTYTHSIGNERQQNKQNEPNECK